jgi:RNA polymerase sigma-70 factor (ECF subfamily)
MSTLAAPDLTGTQLKPEIEQLFREHSHMLYCTAYSMLGNTSDAEDILQTLFLRLLRREVLPDLTANPRGYLYRAAVNLSLTLIRSRKREELTGDHRRLDTPVDPHRPDEAEDAARRLTEAIAELNPDDAQVIILRYIHKHSDAEIARLLGMKRGTVAMRLFRSRRRLKKLMGEER